MAFEGFMPTRWAAVTASDSTDLTGSIGLWIGGDGDLAVRFLGAPSTTVTFASVTAGTIIPGNFTRVMAATTATGIKVAYA